MRQVQTCLKGTPDFGLQLADVDKQTLQDLVDQLQDPAATNKEQIEAVRAKCRTCVVQQLRDAEGELKPVCKGEPDGEDWKKNVAVDAQWKVITKSATTLLSNDVFATGLSTSFKKAMQAPF